MKQKAQKPGRPRLERLGDEDIAFIKAQVALSNTSKMFVAAQFHREVLEEATIDNYTGLSLPSDVESVKSAFDGAFKPDQSKRSSLPELYYRVLEDLYGIERARLPSRCATPQTQITKSASVGFSGTTSSDESASGTEQVFTPSTPPQEPAGDARLSEDTTGDYTSVEREIKEFLGAQNLVRQFDGHAIDLFSSPELRGWKRQQVTHSYAGDYQSPPLFEQMMERFPASPPIREYFGLRQCSALPIADENESVAFELVGGTWKHFVALKQIFLHRHKDARCRMFRNEFERSWIQYHENAPLKGTPLYHHVVAEVLVLTSDNKLVLGKRNEALWLGGLWSASIEEQMLRGDPQHPERRDGHLFDAAHRAVQEELGATVEHQETKLLSVAIAWSNFAGTFFFIVRCEEDFEGVVKKWAHLRHDPNEAVALDCIDATPGCIQAALDSNSYRPTPNWRQRIRVAHSKAGWHATAKARLRVLLGHLHYLEGK